MVSTPGLMYPGTKQRRTMSYTDENGDAIDPSTVTFELMDPYGTVSSYLYGTDANIGKTAVGNYYCDVTPEVGGRFYYRWKATGASTTLNEEGNFTVQASPFVDGIGPRAYGR